MIVCDLETFSTDRVVPYAFGLYKLSKISGRFYRDRSLMWTWKMKKWLFVFKEIDCINSMLHHFLELKGEAERLSYKIVEFIKNLLAQKGTGIDSWVELKKLIHWRAIVNLSKNGKSSVSFEIING